MVESCDGPIKDAPLAGQPIHNKRGVRAQAARGPHTNTTNNGTDVSTLSISATHTVTTKALPTERNSQRLGSVKAIAFSDDSIQDLRQRNGTEDKKETSIVVTVEEKSSEAEIDFNSTPTQRTSSSDSRPETAIVHHRKNAPIFDEDAIWQELDGGVKSVSATYKWNGRRLRLRNGGRLRLRKNHAEDWNRFQKEVSQGWESGELGEEGEGFDGGAKGTPDVHEDPDEDPRQLQAAELRRLISVASTEFPISPAKRLTASTESDPPDVDRQRSEVQRRVFYLDRAHLEKDDGAQSEDTSSDSSTSTGER